MRKDEIDKILGSDTEPNEPKKTALIGGTTGKRNVTKMHEDDAKKRKEEIARMLALGPVTGGRTGWMDNNKQGEKG